MTPDRRTFLRRSTAALSAGVLAGPEALDETARQSPERQRDLGTQVVRALDEALLRAVGDAVLPESLSADQREDAIASFELWLEGFDPVAELSHPYGGDVVPYGPPDPAPGWSAQLAALDLIADARYQAPFGELDRGARRTLLQEQITDPGEGLPSTARARHIGAALMAHYFGSPVATDRCYGVAIRKLECRSNDNVGGRPPAVGS
jgi:hypothetical protein